MKPKIIIFIIVICFIVSFIAYYSTQVRKNHKEMTNISQNTTNSTQDIDKLTGDLTFLNENSNEKVKPVLKPPTKVEAPSIEIELTLLEEIDVDLTELKKSLHEEIYIEAGIDFVSGSIYTNKKYMPDVEKTLNIKLPEIDFEKNNYAISICRKIKSLSYKTSSRPPQGNGYFADFVFGKDYYPNTIFVYFYDNSVLLLDMVGFGYRDHTDVVIEE